MNKFLISFLYFVFATVFLSSQVFAATIFNADFESGDFTSLTGTPTTPLSGGLEGSIGAYFGKGTYWDAKVVNSPAIGNYSAALTIGSGSSTAAYLFTYNPAVPSTGLGMYKASYYVPSTIVPDTWWNVWQWKSVDTTYSKPIIDLNLIKKNDVLQLRMSYVPGGSSVSTTQYIYQTNPVAFPTDKWVNVRGYYIAQTTNTGMVQIYQDDVKILELANIMTKPGGKNVLWSVNSYADKISPNPATIYIDNMSVESLTTAVPLDETTTNATPVISTTSLVAARVNKSYSANVVATDADKTNVLTLTASGLPQGLTFSKVSASVVNGQSYVKYSITGKATVKGTYSVVVVAKDDKGASASKTLKLVVK